MNLTNLLDYGNSIYHFDELINSVERKNDGAIVKAGTALKIWIVGLFTKCDSVNAMMNSIHNSDNNRINNIFAKGEFKPKTHAFRDCINDIDYNDVKSIHEQMLKEMNDNKFFYNHKYRNTNVMIVDGVEAFETKKKIEGLHTRHHKDGSIGYYYKSLGLMWLADDVDVMIDMVPFDKTDVTDDTEHNSKIKSESEITVFKRIIPKLVKYKTEVCVLDCMFLNAPCMNAAKKENIDVVIKLTDDRRDLYKDASKLFNTQNPKKEYEMVEVSELRKIKYSKACKKKDISVSNKYIKVREISNNELNDTLTIVDKKCEHPKKTIITKVTEKVIKKVKVWADTFEMNKYEYGKVKVLKVTETVKEKNNTTSKDMYIVTTLLNDDLEFIVDLMHRRWDIELKGFRKLKSTYNIDHLYIGTDNAIRLAMYLTMIIYNLVELYFNVHTKKYRRKLNLKNLFEEFKIQIYVTTDFYKYFRV